MERGLDKFHGSFDNAGFVFSTKIGNTTALRFAQLWFQLSQNEVPSIEVCW